MYFYETRRTIAAPAHIIWSILTDADQLQSGRFGIKRIDGRITPGEKIKLWSDISPERAFALKVTEFDPNRKMVWQGGMPFGLFRGTRHFTLRSTDDDGTEFHMREDFTGPLVKLIWKSMPDLGPTFETFADAVTHLAEEQSK